MINPEEPNFVKANSKKLDKFQKQYVREVYQEESNQRIHRQVRDFRQSYLRDARFYYAVLGVVVAFYFLNKELNLIHRLTPLQNQLTCISCRILGYLNPAQLVDLFQSLRQDFFTVHSLLSLCFFTLVAGFVLVNISEDLYEKYVQEQEEQELIDSRMAETHWYQRIKPHKFDQTIEQHTNNKLKELYASTEYQQYMQRRDKSTVNWQGDDFPIEDMNEEPVSDQQSNGSVRSSDLDKLEDMIEEVDRELDQQNEERQRNEDEVKEEQEQEVEAE